MSELPMEYMKVAVRAHTEIVHNRDESATDGQEQGWAPTEVWPELVLVFDTETTTDVTQRLLFAPFRVYRGRRLQWEGIVLGDDLSDSDRRIITDYCQQHVEDDRPRGRPLAVLTRDAFCKKVLHRVGYRRRGVIVGFNLPFDLSRLAEDWSKARGRYSGGFSFRYLSYTDKGGKVKPNTYEPRIAIKCIDSRRSLIGYTSAFEDRKPHRGHFVDLRTLTYALSGRPHSLASACKAFGASEQKGHAEEYGRVTPELIDYARQDVRATWDLYVQAMAEYHRHPISLEPDRAYSPASIGRAYLKEMGIQIPRIEIEAGLGLAPGDISGYAMASYYGGRAECHIRKVAVPVRYCDFLSMYPTVNVLMGLWRFLTADHILAYDATDEVKQLLAAVSADDMFQPDTWRRLPAFVQIVPDGDRLPVRAKYGQQDAYNIGLNHLTDSLPHWYTLADVAASKLLTGKVPLVLRAIGLRPVGVQPGLKPVKLRGTVEINPYQDDFFKRIIEERKRLKADKALPPEERQRMDHALKITANSTSYGIFVQLDRQQGESGTVKVFSDEWFMSVTDHIEQAGPFYLPVMGALITGAARLMLALAQHEVERRGGTYAFTDTDSMAIVATASGGLMPCPGGPECTEDGREAIRLLTYADVEEIRERFRQLSPYDRSVIAGSLLQLENVNDRPPPDDEVLTFDKREVRHSRLAAGELGDLVTAPPQLWAYVIAAKRYALFNDLPRQIVLRKYSEHGLGQYKSARADSAPVDDEDQDGEELDDPLNGLPGSGIPEEWIGDFWLDICACALGDLKEGFEQEYAWGTQPTVTQLSLTSPSMMAWVSLYNRHRPGW